MGVGGSITAELLHTQVYGDVLWEVHGKKATPNQGYLADSVDTATWASMHRVLLLGRPVGMKAMRMRQVGCWLCLFECFVVVPVAVMVWASMLGVLLLGRPVGIRAVRMRQVG